MNTLRHKKQSSAMESGEASRRREAGLQENVQNKSARKRVLALTSFSEKKKREVEET